MAAVENDSYCTAAMVEALVQTGTLGVGTTPTTQEGLEFQASRAAIIYSWMRESVGDDAPGPASYSTSLDNTTDAGKALEFLCQQANAAGAAADVLSAAGASDSPARTERIAELLEIFASYMEPIQKAAKEYVGGDSIGAETHISRGEMNENDYTNQDEPGIEFDRETAW